MVLLGLALGALLTASAGCAGTLAAVSDIGCGEVEPGPQVIYDVEAGVIVAEDAEAFERSINGCALDSSATARR